MTNKDLPSFDQIDFGEGYESRKSHSCPGVEGPVERTPPATAPGLRRLIDATLVDVEEWKAGDRCRILEGSVLGAGQSGRLMELGVPGAYVRPEGELDYIFVPYEEMEPINE